MGKQASINLLDSTKDMGGNEIAGNNKDIKLPDLITFIEFMLERKIDNLGALTEHQNKDRSKCSFSIYI